MAENDDVPGSPDADVQAEQPGPPPAAVPAAPVLKTRWRDRAWSFRAMLAVALASVLIGGAGGAAVMGAAGDHHDGRDRMGHYGPGGMMPPGLGRRMPRNFGDRDNGQWGWQQVPPNGMVPQPNSPQPTSPLPPSPSASG